MLPYMTLICMVAILAGILNVHRHFAAPAAAPIVLNIFIIGSIVLTGWALRIPAEKQVFFVAVGVLLAGLAQIVIQLVPLRKHRVRLRPAWDVHSGAFRKIIFMMGPMILGLTATQLNTLADDVIALSIMDARPDILSYGAPSYLYYAQRLYQFPLGVLGISLATAIFPVMSSDAARKDYDALTRTISRGFRAAIFVAVPATAGIFLVAKPLVSAIFEHGRFTASDTTVVAFTLSFYAIGLCGYFAQQLVTRAYYSLQDPKTPMYSALLAVVVNIILNLTLVWYMGTAGLALSTAICSYLQVAVLTGMLNRRLRLSVFAGIPTTAAKTAAAAILMYAAGVGVLVFMKTLPQTTGATVLKLAAVVLVCTVVYIAAARVLKIRELALLTGRHED
jgi:putative peptidoglycan lipid II flippase